MGEHAVVLGCSVGGLLAARVLADHFDDVTVIERDTLPDGVAQRRGVPQGRHVHGLLASGAQALDDLFPGFLDDLVDDGAVVLDGSGVSRVSMTFAGHPLNLNGPFTRPITSYLATRPFLEAHVRQRVRAISNVEILDGHDAVEFIVAGAGRVTGVRVAAHDGSSNREVVADLVVDATGRAARTPAFLESVGYRRPIEHRNTIHVAYTSQLLHIPPDAIVERLFLIGARPELLCGGALFACENDTWMLTLVGMTGLQPPVDREGMLRFAEKFAPAAMMTALRAAAPLTEPVTYRYPASVRRFYERLSQFPTGLLVFGDAICSFNPVYGQGMSVAALEALALRDCLNDGPHELARRFFRAAAKPLGRAWQMASGADLTLPDVEGHRSPFIRFTNRYTERVLTAAESDGAVAETFLRVTNLVDAPSELLRPSIVARVMAAAGHRGPAGSTPHARVPAQPA
ncbi:2-polyprenyl-6-methoxyphenol hydroxylase-like oxidoreductase [Mycobacterium aquaticum]|uniref:2-polyprenyl-6-methoxyphenol hydroxylase-like oxidoreductase n=2 Tax=Mycobacterium aquaticum TaxID=1927124 RepID=A0A1X0AFB1_9MYCO|nr:2-polyprenyl-6-methoxyphenol hydroxylase-like oxidoreductase [Mycobacterium aquaticum]